MGQKKSCDYYTTKYQEINLEYTEVKKKLEKLKALKKHKENLEKELF